MGGFQSKQVDDLVERELVDDPVKWVDAVDIPQDSILKPHQRSGIRELHGKGARKTIFYCDRMGSGKTLGTVGFIRYALDLPETRSIIVMIHPAKHGDIWHSAVNEMHPSYQVEAIKHTVDLLAFVKGANMTPRTCVLVSSGVLSFMYMQCNGDFKYFLEFIYKHVGVFVLDECHKAFFTGSRTKLGTKEIIRSLRGVAIFVTGTPFRTDPKAELRMIYETLGKRVDKKSFDVDEAVDKLRASTLLRTGEQLRNEGMVKPLLDQKIVYVDPPTGPFDPVIRRVQPVRASTKPKKPKNPIRSEAGKQYHEMRHKCFRGTVVPKFDYIMTLLGEMGPDDRLVIGVEHILVQDALVRYLKSNGVDDVEIFRTQAPSKRVLVTINSRGVGHNWTDYNYMAILQFPSSPSALEQVMFRIHRMNSPHGVVHIRHVLTRGSRLEKHWFDRLRERQSTINNITEILSQG